jgi:hypothetical protein
MIERARRAGFWSSYALEHDAAFRTVRTQPEFIHEIDTARTLEADFRGVCDKELGAGFFQAPGKTGI